ncbi:RNA polymerase sigma factor [Aporhodopirellula aestuarii]|uniref:RNA polymerase sigma-70 region 2 domain-containing protein n=1 Tax=Aporhodopirellula aestuarii TaxID=2950107 RepID=A0ABT0UAH4_9BACT|nr:sigma factor [Aporhodopirellula aestuarii]MCM2373999.1 hypothetical protein [Aporhodopirellula aestuarii]
MNKDQEQPIQVEDTRMSGAATGSDVDRIARQAGQFSRQLSGLPAEQVEQRKELEEKIFSELTLLEGTLQELFRSVGRRKGLSLADVDDVCQRFLLQFTRKIRHFQGGCFRAWLSRCAENAIKDYHRSQNRQPTATEPYKLRDFDSDGRSLGHHKEDDMGERLRNVDLDVLRSEVTQWMHQSGPPHATWRRFFVIASGLSFCLPDHPQPLSGSNEWPSHDCIWHANRSLIEMTEESFVDQPATDAVTLHDHEKEFERRLKAVRSTATQNLNRHYWRFLQFPTVWNWVLRFVPPLEFDPDPVPDEDSMRMLLYFGGWLALDSPLLWHRWLDRHGLKNATNQNYIRCLVPSAGFDPAQTASATLHPRWVKLIDQWFESAASVPIPEQTRNVKEMFPLLQHASRMGHLKDLPVPFRSEAIDAPTV